MPTKRLSSEDIKTIQKALEATGGAQRPAVRLLKEQGTPYSMGSVSNVYHNGAGDWGELKDVDTQAKLAAAEARIRSLAGQKAHLLTRLGQAMEFNDEILAAVHAFTPLKRRDLFIPKAIRSDTIITAGLAVGDWHIGEVIDRDEMEGFNKFNFDIATRRVEYLTDKLLHWIQTERQGHNIKDLWIFGLSDFISGDIHDELITTNEFPSPVACVKAAKLLAWLVGALAPHFENIFLEELAADNHARLTRKKQAKRKGKNTFNYPMFCLLNEMLSKHENVHPTLHTSPKVQLDVDGMSILVEHGDDVRGWMGFPFYGIERQEGREAQKRLRKGKPYDLHLFGHWHAPQMGPDWRWIVNGSLSGASELDVLSGRYADPCQVSFLLNTKIRQLFGPVKWNLLDA